MTTTIVHFLLDKSGSMMSAFDETIEGFNEYIGELRKSPDEILFSLTQFDTRYAQEEPDYLNINVAAVPMLTRESYQPRGGTPLFDALGHTIGVTENLVRDRQKINPTMTPRVLIVTLTDGEENESHDYNLQRINDLIKRKETDGDWAFMFLAAEPEAWGTVRGMTVNSVSAKSTYLASGGRGRIASFRAAGQSTASYSGGASSSHMVSDTQRQAVAEASDGIVPVPDSTVKASVQGQPAPNDETPSTGSIGDRRRAKRRES